MKIGHTIAILLCASVRLFAYGDQDQDRNHPEVKWFTSETEHFRFHYEKGLREAAEACASRAEAVYPEITALYGWEPSGKTDFLVYDEDYSNGWAIASLNTMAIWDADLGFDLRGTKDWIRDVVAHEFSHVVSIQLGAKAKPWISDLELGWDDASDHPATSSGWLLWSLDPYSMSMAEGTAQWTSEKMGGDRWDSHRAMIQRVAADADSLLPWGRMGSFSGTGLDFERVYGQGYSLMRHIERMRGREFAAKWWRELSRWPAQTPGGAWKSLTGQDVSELWSQWRDSAKALARREIEAASPLVEGRRLFGDGYNTRSPRWWNDTLILLSSNRGSDIEANSLWACALRPRDTADRSWVVAPTIHSRFSLDTSARTVWFHSGREDDSRGRPVLDLYKASLHPGKKDSARLEADPKDKQKRLTRELHAFSPSVRGDSLATVVRERQAFRVRIMPSDGSGEGRVLYPRADSSGVGLDHTIFSVEWSPDGKTLAIDRFDGRLRRVDLVDRAGKFLRRAGDSLSEWRDPWFSPDGKWLYFSSDRTGIFDLYRQDLSTDSLEQITSVKGGAFQPVPSPDGARVAYISWDHDGFALHLLDTLRPFAPRPAAAVAPTPVDSAPAQETWNLSEQEHPYSAIPDRALLSPILYAQRTAPLFGYESSQWNYMVGERAQILDPQRRNTVVLLGLLDVGHGFSYFDFNQPNMLNPRQEKVFLVGWENRSWWPTLYTEASWQSLRGQDTSTSLTTGTPVLTKTPWAMQVASVVAGARYSLTRNQKIHGEVSWTGYDFNYYDDNFRFSAYSSIEPSLFWTYLDKVESGDDKLADQRGTFARVQFSTGFSDLERSGTFDSVFIYNSSNGTYKVKTVGSTVHRLYADFREAVGNPLWNEQTLELDAQLSGILGWESGADTLNDFYMEGLSVPGYPDYVPGSTETRLFQGTHTAYAQISTRFPLVRIRGGAWIWFFDDWSAALSAQAGRAWSGAWYDTDRSFRSQMWEFSRSVSWETRLSGRIHNAYPFHLSLKFSRGLDHPDGIHQSQARVFGVPTGAHRIEFGLNTGLDEWAIIDQPLRRLGLLPAARRLW